MSVEERLALITRNLDEVMGTGKEKMRAIMEQGKDVRVYWGTATTGKPHIGYFVPLTKISDFLRAGCHVTILFADLHAYLDNMKAPWALLEQRTKYYEALIKAMLTSIGVSLEKLHFVQGSTFQLSKEYTLDMYKMTSLVTERNAKKAGAEVVKQLDSPYMSGMLYPLLQALDEEYLHVDAQFGGVDQRKIFTFAEEFLPKIGYNKRVHLMNPMVPSLKGRRVVDEAVADGKMSSSDNASKIDILDSAKTVKAKIKEAFCEEGNVEQNALLEFVRLVLFPLNGDVFDIERPEKHGGSIHFDSFHKVKEAFAAKKLHPLDLKNGVTAILNRLLDPVRQTFTENSDLQKLVSLAYPEEAPKTTKKNKAAPKSKDVSRLLIKVGRIVSIEKHAEADGLFVEQIDVGEGEPRQIVSGLVRHYKKEDLENKLCLVLCNLKPSKLVKVTSSGMLLAATKDDRVAIVCPPQGSSPGDVVSFEGFPSNPDGRVKSDVLTAVLADLKTDDKGQLLFLTVPGVVSSGPCSSTLTDATVR